MGVPSSLWLAAARCAVRGFLLAILSVCLAVLPSQRAVRLLVCPLDKRNDDAERRGQSNQDRHIGGGARVGTVHRSEGVCCACSAPLCTSPPTPRSQRLALRSACVLIACFVRDVAIAQTLPLHRHGQHRPSRYSLRPACGLEQATRLVAAPVPFAHPRVDTRSCWQPAGGLANTPQQIERKTGLSSALTRSRLSEPASYCAAHRALSAPARFALCRFCRRRRCWPCVARSRCG
jgi:hypothetical protein